MKHLTFRLLFFVLIIIQLSVFNFAQTKPDETSLRLEQGKPVERELKGGEVHVYSIQLKAGQLLNLIVDQRGIDVVAALFAPDRKQLVEIDSPNGTQGPEPITIIAETAGEYQLKVQSLEKEAAAGRYEARIVELRDATRQDISRLTALRLIAQAEELSQQQKTADSQQRILEKYQEAIQNFRAANDIRGEINTLFSIGQAHSRTGKFSDTLVNYQQALKLSHKGSDPEAQATALERIGDTYVDMGEHQKAIETYNQLLALGRILKDKYKEATGLNLIGVLYSKIGEWQLALDFLNQALLIYKDLNDQSKQGVAFLNIGAVYSDLGEGQKAIYYWEQARQIWHDLGHTYDEAVVLLGIGTYYLQIGEYQKALEYFTPILAQARKQEDRRLEIYALNNLGRTYSLLKEWQKAFDFLNQSLLMSREKKEDIEGVILTNLGALYYDKGELEKAIDYYKQALDLHRATLNRTEEAGALYLIARVERDRGNFKEARNAIESAITIIETLRTNVLGQQLRSSYFSKVHRDYEIYIDILMNMHKQDPAAGYDMKAFHISESARARSLLDTLVESKANIRQGVDYKLLQQEQTLQEQLNNKANEQMRLLSKAHTPDQAATAKKSVEDASIELQNIQTQIRQRSPRYAALTQPQPSSVPEIQGEILDADTILLEYSLGEKRSYLWAVSKTSTQSFELPPGSEIEKSVRGVVSLLNNGKRWASDVEIKGEYSKAVTPLSRKLIPSKLVTQLKGRRLIIVPDGALQYLPFGVLPLLSEESKTEKNKTHKTDSVPLAVEHEIISLPSASTLAVLRRETKNRKSASKSIAIFADPVFSETDERLATVKANQSKVNQSAKTDLNRLLLERAFNWNGESNKPLSIPRLPFTRREAEGIFAIASTVTSLKALDFEANRNNVLNPALSDYRIIHFATHGLLNSEQPELSGIVLSLVNEQGQPVDGFLRLNEVYNLNLSADLVVLSACQTALGKEIRGEGLVGLTRGFMYAGSPRVVASLWKVDDVATAELMKLFYQKMLREKIRPAAALRAAKVEMWKQKRWNAPFYWAAFELQGEWR
jgi:CHAT domain-containing protein/uncharacterized protein HemY